MGLGVRRSKNTSSERQTPETLPPKVQSELEGYIYSNLFKHLSFSIPLSHPSLSSSILSNHARPSQHHSILSKPSHYHKASCRVRRRICSRSRRQCSRHYCRICRTVCACSSFILTCCAPILTLCCFSPFLLQRFSYRSVRPLVFVARRSLDLTFFVRDVPSL